MRGKRRNNQTTPARFTKIGLCDCLSEGQLGKPRKKPKRFCHCSMNDRCAFNNGVCYSSRSQVEEVRSVWQSPSYSHKTNQSSVHVGATWRGPNNYCSMFEVHHRETYPNNGVTTIALGFDKPVEISCNRCEPLRSDTSINLVAESVQYNLSLIQSTAKPSGL